MDRFDIINAILRAEKDNFCESQLAEENRLAELTELEDSELDEIYFDHFQRFPKWEEE